MNLTENFTREELACSHCGRMQIPLAAVQWLQKVRDRFGAPLKVNSGYRCPEHNQAVSSTGPNGPHTKASFDIAIFGGEALRLVRIAIEEGATGIGIKQHGPHEKRFIHLDILPYAEGQPRPFIWSYP